MPVTIHRPNEEETLKRNLPELIDFEFDFAEKKFKIKSFERNKLVCVGSDGVKITFTLKAMARMMRDRRIQRGS